MRSTIASSRSRRAAAGCSALCASRSRRRGSPPAPGRVWITDADPRRADQGRPGQRQGRAAHRDRQGNRRRRIRRGQRLGRERASTARWLASIPRPAASPSASTWARGFARWRLGPRGLGDARCGLAAPSRARRSLLPLASLSGAGCGDRSGRAVPDRRPGGLHRHRRARPTTGRSRARSCHCCSAAATSPARGRRRCARREGRRSATSSSWRRAPETGVFGRMIT